MSDFIGHTIAGGITGLLLVAVFHFLSGARGLTTAILLVFFGSIIIAHDGYIALGLFVALLLIWVVWAAKMLLQQK
jgi:hypothetical protein